MIIMVNTHNKTFFGINSALLVRSDSKKNPYIFLKGFEKKEDGAWEKPSAGEGKAIKLSLEEIISLLHILREEKNSWKTKHDFQERRTEIVFKWIPEEILNITMNNYSIKLKKSQVELLEMLLDHILQEKIIYATSLEVIAEREFSSETQEERIEIEGIVEGSTEKAVRINFGEGKEVWIPKSTIHSDFKLERGSKQTFIIDSWVLNRKDVL
jgi:RNase P/RNase MRP subunit p29